jgi:hypothetical protein
LAEEEELNQPVNFEKYKLEYNNIKVKTFRQAMLRVLGGFCDNIVCAYLIDHCTAVFIYRRLFFWFAA